MGLFDVQPYQNPNHDTQDFGERLEDYANFKKEQVSSGSSDSIVSDFGDDAIHKLANELNLKLDSTSKDYLYQYYLADKASKNAFDRELQASSTQYQRTVQDLKKAGLNPFLAFDSLRGSTASSSAGSVTGGLGTSRANQKTQAGQQAASSILSILGIIAAAAIYALA